MPYVTVLPDELRNPNSPPSSLVAYLDQAQWQAIYKAHDDSLQEVACASCCMIALTCAWCCPDSVRFGLMMGQGLPGRLRTLNRDFFWDKPVVQARNEHIVVQTDYVLEFQRGIQMAPAHDDFTPVVAAMPMPSNAFQPHQAGPPAQQYQPAVPVYEPVQAVPRKMDVIVPPGAPPGSVLSVQDANGQIVQVTVPPGVTAGMKLEFEY